MVLEEARAAYTVQSMIQDRPDPPDSNPGVSGTHSELLSILHPRIGAAAGELFNDAHYRQSIFEACLALQHAVREKSGSTAKDGTALMENVFSARRPILEISDDQDERRGFMWLFEGAIMGLRNPRGHGLSTDNDMTPEECLEWLAFLSALMRVVDRSEKMDGKREQ